MRTLRATLPHAPNATIAPAKAKAMPAMRLNLGLCAKWMLPSHEACLASETSVRKSELDMVLLKKEPSQYAYISPSLLQ
jgi:hypothetical protein